MKKINIKFFSCLFTLTMLLLSGSMMAQTFTGTSANPFISSNNAVPTTSVATAAAVAGTIGAGAFVDNVTIDITHTWDGDMDITLISPVGTTLDLSSGNGSLNDNYTNTVFQDGAPSITTGTPPFTGTFQAEGGTFAATFAGEDPNGTWTLSVVDNVGGDDGNLNSFEITFGATCAIDPVADVVVDNDPGTCGANVTLIANAPTCTDPVTNDFNAGGLDASGLYPVGVTTVTFDAGGGVTETATVTVTDTEAPTVVCPGDMTIHLDPGACEQVLSYDITATDNCPFLTGPFQAPAIATAQGGGSTFDMIYFDVENTGADDISITSLDQGVFAGGTWNWEVYTASTSVGNQTNAGAWTQVGAASVSSGGNSLANIPLSTSVTVPAGGSVGFAVGISFPAGFPLLYDFAPVAPYPTDANGITMSGGGATTNLFSGTLLAPRGWIGNVNYEIGGEVEVIADPANTVASGGAFPIGTTTLTYTATDANGLQGSCTFSVTVIEYVPTSNDITCNSLVNITLDENCESTVGADQILEGNNYGCYDNFDVTFAATGLPLVLNSTHVGETIEVMVTNPAGVPCWGYILVEDKTDPIITCYDIDLECDEALPTEPAPESTTAGTVATITDGGNGGAVGGMVYFDVTNNTQGNLILTAFDMNITANTLVDVYTKSGTFAGSEANAAAWTLAGQLDATTGAVSGPFPGDGTLTPAIGGNVSIAPGVNGIALHTLSAANNYTNGNGANQSFGDAFITVDLGSASNGPFGAPFVPRVFNGAVQYLQPLPQVSATDACGAVTVTFTDEVEELGCNAGGFSEIITRTWTATDASGNATSCTATYRRIIQTLDDVLADLPTDLVLECGDAIPAVMTDIGCSNIGIALENESTIDICEGSYKLLRNYILVDWCTNETVEHFQIIKVLDTQAPTVNALADLTISTNSNDCLGAVQLPTATATDACSSATVSATSSSAGTLSGNLLTGLPVGSHTVTYTATDACGNESTGVLNITVEDQIAPIAICDEFTIVGIGSDGNASINAATFDDGSTDNCGIVEMSVRRMDNAACPGFDGTAYGASVPFFCCDVNTTVMVEFRVRDAAGNVNSCMVEVEVQDKIDPTVICAADANVDCSETYLDYIEVGQALPQDAVDANGEAIASDNCPGVSLANNVIGNTVDCGSGTVTVVWTATDAVGRTSSCIQRYFVTNANPFTESDITWPSDYTANTCGTGLEPSDLSSPYNYPTVDEGACNNVAIGHGDQVLDFGVADACLKILRTWYVVDWCQAGANQDPTQPGPGVWHHTQIIKVVNSNDPNVTVVDFPSVV
ncbi:HYR domain-containing protein, partial [Saprospiraceae bacterium]|nr:HYR domain-containing protein [Saprospiraceae bacterium]